MLSVSIFSVCLVISFFELNKSVSIFANTTPKSDKKIIIDAGHGGLTNTTH